MRSVESLPGLNVKRTLSVVDREEETREDERDDGHEFHDNVESGTTCVLERITHRVTHNSSLVLLTSFLCDANTTLTVIYLELTFLNVPVFRNIRVIFRE